MYQSPLLSPEARAILAKMQNPGYAQQVDHGIASLEKGTPPQAQNIPPNLMQLLKEKAVIDAARQIQSPPVQSPQGTVAGDVNNQFQQVMSGQAPQGMPPQGAMPPQQGMPPQGMPPQGMPPQQAMPQPAPGLAGLPVSNIGTQNMASGGIVAFADGGDIYGAAPSGMLPPYRDSYIPEDDSGPTSEPTDEEQKQLLLAQLASQGSFGGLYRPMKELHEKIKGIDPEAEGVTAEKDYTDSPWNEVLKTQKEKLTVRGPEDIKRLEEEGKYARAAGIAGALTKGAKTDWELFGYAVSGLADAKRATSEKIGAAQTELEKRQFDLAAKEEAYRQSKTEAKRNAVDKAQARIDALNGKLIELETNNAQIDATLEAANAKAKGKSEKYTPANVVADNQLKKEAALRAAMAAPEGSKAQKDALAAAEYYDGLAADAAQYLPTTSTWTGADKAAFNRFFEAADTKSAINLAKLQLQSADKTANDKGLALLQDMSVRSGNPEEFMRRAGVAAGASAAGAGGNSDPLGIR
jgi:hypothetical protein